MFPQIETIELFKMASGDILSLQVYKFIGKKLGKKVYIQSNLHGAEIVGNAVIQKLIAFLSTVNKIEIQGEIWLVPVCNPLGTNQRGHFFATGRFNSYDGKNWNRIFWDYEKECNDLIEFAREQLNKPREIIRKNYLEKIQLAWQQELLKLQQPSSTTISNQYRTILQSLCLDADYVIDIHSSSNQAIDFIFCFATREKSANHFLIDYGILMTEYDGDAFDEAFLKPWLALEKELQKLGQNIQFDLESWTLELGSGMTMNSNSVAVGFQGIKNYLMSKKVLLCAEKVLTKKIKFVQRNAIKSYYAATGGMIQNRLPLHTQVEKGDRIYQLLSFNKQQKLPEVIDVHAENAGIIFDLATNQSVNQGEYVLDILERK
jgi:uncharacterized protein